MARPTSELPTSTELVVLNYVYANGPSLVGEVWKNDPRGKRRAYTSIMSLMSVMFDKGLLDRKTENRAYRYSAKLTQAEIAQTDARLHAGAGIWRVDCRAALDAAGDWEI